MVKNKIVAKHASRVAAVQACYQSTQIQTPYENVLKAFLDNPGHTRDDDKNTPNMEKDLFVKLMRSYGQNIERIDDLINSIIGPKWNLDRLESVIRSILRIGTAEFLLEAQKDAAIIINEYVEVTHEFYGGKEPGFVNGVLDALAKKLGLKDNKKTNRKFVISGESEA